MEWPGVTTTTLKYVRLDFLKWKAESLNQSKRIRKAVVIQIMMVLIVYVNKYCLVH